MAEAQPVGYCVPLQGGLEGQSPSKKYNSNYQYFFRNLSGFFKITVQQMLGYRAKLFFNLARPRFLPEFGYCVFGGFFVIA